MNPNNAPQLLQIVFNKTASKKARSNKSLQYCIKINYKAISWIYELPQGFARLPHGVVRMPHGFVRLTHGFVRMPQGFIMLPLEFKMLSAITILKPNVI